MRFHKEICDIIEDREDLNLTIVAEKIGVSKQYISKFKNKGTIGFCQLVKLSHVLSDENKTSKETMDEWCLKLDTVESIKQSFEYACVTRNVELLNKLILKHENETGTVHEYVSVYRILYQYIIGEVHGTEIINQLKKVGQPKDKILNILMDIMKCYNYFHLKKYNLMLELIQEIEEQVEAVDGDRKSYIKECYIYRVAEIFAPVYLHYNHVELARKFANVIIEANISAKTISDALYILGMSYLRVEKYKSLQYFEDSYEIFKIVKDEEYEKEVRYNLDLAKIYFEETLEFDSDPILIQFQNKRDEQSLNLLQSSLYDGTEEDFLVYYKGVVNESPTGIYECFQKFLLQSNYFFTSLVAKEIYKRGDRSELIKSMVDFKGDIGKGVFCSEKDNFYNLSCINSIHSNKRIYRNGSRELQTK
ncbi:AimR family lysis-lysogeny pheromone receptor [Bacillus cereus group sp. N21]|uniref:AimR family lysis-lysogeny pheromone receptor n=1 Tax=Bacillus cereus group sp. N21 TaxID=2794591 RepID=UPI0018F303FF|nr:AimR family lysis-lysogeny pheromone receptor [Bacillus cereus group sp. N21]MBJ8031564.1 helix-turn-helix transcriptional regulator [Bacillus cereus group sp. N21]